jgi:hypothetical protein
VGVGEWGSLDANTPAAVLQISHSTILVQMGGFTFLTDPIWSNRWAAPRSRPRWKWAAQLDNSLGLMRGREIHRSFRWPPDH